MDLYPSYRYHRTHGAKRVDSPAAAEALGPGWHENPDDCLTPEELAAKRAAERPAPPPPDGFGSTPQGYVPVPFPSFRFRVGADGSIESRRVVSEEAVVALGPGWYESPQAAQAPPPVDEAPVEDVADVSDEAAPKRRGRPRKSDES